ncbi:MAG: excinuclease ABC subunit UvrC [Firmicutes bacterium]|nr:excinuclease ABC subunit UvrC [Bacillota bacterium]
MSHFDIAGELKKLPQRPGVYIMRDVNDVIIYVGKANNLYNRVRSYFQKSNNNVKTQQLARCISHFEYLVTDNENEAFILENNLIKLHRPKYNIRLKDEKGYPYIKITRERLPRVLYSHQRGKDKAKYYGPFVSKTRVRELLDLIHKLWPLRRCAKQFPRDFDKDRPCLNHHIGQCKAPCNRLLSEETYNVYLNEAERFIQGKTNHILERLTTEMQQAAENLEFERAAELRDTIDSLKLLTEKQKAETDGDDRDVIAIARNNGDALIQIFFIRDGKLSGREHFIMSINTQEADVAVTSDPHECDGDILAAFIKQFYSEAAFVPKEISVVAAPSDRESIAVWLSGLAGRQVSINVPQKGEKRNMINLAQTNAELTAQQFGAHIKKEAERNQAALDELSEIMGINTPLTRIEAYDISNTQGYESVGSMIVFENGKAKNSDYRKFRLRAVIGPDDYAGMEEIITRRLTRYKEAHDAFSKLPDIIFVDGGKGQITAAEKALRAVSLNVPICGMVKDDRHRTRGLLFQGKELSLPRHSEGFRLVTRIQDEVHRFALEYHRKLRADSQVRSVLDDIPGIGPTRRKELLKHFKGIEAIRNATPEELTQAPSMNKKAADTVYKFFNDTKETAQNEQ